MRKILAGLALALSLGWCLDARAGDDQTIAKCVVNPTTAADGETMPLPCNDSGQLVTSSTGGGGGGGSVDQGTAAAASGAWPVQLVIGGAVNAVGNPIFVKPGTGATWAVTGTFWQATQPISAAALPLPSGAATAANQASILTAIGSPFQAGASIGNTAFIANAGTNLNTSALAVETGGNLAQLVTDAGAPGATACATDTASCNFNQLLQRLAQRLTTINTALGSPFQAGGALGAGSAIIGKVGIDQTTDVTTNGVEIAPTAAAAAGVTPTVSASAEGSHVLKSGAGNLYTLTTTIGATTGYIMLFDATSAPADGAVAPKWCKPVLSNGSLGGDTESWSPGPPLAFSTGVTVVFSSTGCFSKTASASATFSAQVR